MAEFGGQISLGRLFGIPIRLHWSWFPIFILLAVSLSGGFFSDFLPGESTLFYWILGTITSLLFFASVLLHEMGHAITAKRVGIQVDHISLFIMGGVANIREEPRTAGEEFRIAIAGPLASLAIAASFEIFSLLASRYSYLEFPFAWLARVNLILVLFNMLPGFPLDGGRVFRSAIWHFTRDFDRATRLSEHVSSAIAFGFFALAIYLVYRGQLIDGIWIGFIGWFIQNAVSSNRAQSRLNRSLDRVRVGNIMTNQYNQVTMQTPVTRMVAGILYDGWYPVIFVEDQDKLRGMLFLRDLVALPRGRWDHLTADQVMVPLDIQDQLQPDTTLLAAMLAMDHTNLAFLPVLLEGRPAGVVSREQVLQYIRSRDGAGS